MAKASTNTEPWSSFELNMEQYRIRIEGTVQGVMFRKHTVQVAKGLMLSGFVRNESDGSVSIEVEGPLEKIGELLAWCLRGPEEALVSAIKVEKGTIKGYEGFHTKR